jgi:hypothetical protein
MADVDQGLIDYAVAHGYTEAEARAHYGKSATSSSPSTDWAMQQGQQNVANQTEALKNLPTPDLAAAASQNLPVVANVVKSNATNLFQGLDNNPDDQVGREAAGAVEAGVAYGLYRTLKDKVIGGTVPQPAPAPAPPAIAPAPVATPETPAISNIAKLQQRLNPVPAIPAPVLSPEEVRQQRLKVAGTAAQQEMAISGAAAPLSTQGATPISPAPPAPTDTPPVTPPAAPPAPPPPAPPSASPEPTPESVIVNNTTGASPVDKANALVNAPETPATPATPAATTETAAPATETKVKGAAAPRAGRGTLAGIANNPAPVEGMPGMRENYTKPKGINPVTGEPFIGPGGYNWLHGQEGQKTPGVYKNLFGEKNVPYEEVRKVYRDYAMSGQEPGTGLNEPARNALGGTNQTPKYIPEYIKGAVTPAALATTAVATALPALAIAAYRKYQGNEAAVNSSLQDAKDSLQSLATMPYDVSKAAMKGDLGPLKDLMMSLNPGSLLFNEMNKKDEQIIKNMIQKEKVGAGRGLQGVPPPSNR